MYKLTPILHPIVETFLDDHKTVRELVGAYGSPLNIVFPDIVKENVLSFSHAMEAARLSGKVYVAHKPNKSIALIRRLAVERDLCIDVASLGELQSALDAGFEGSRIGATGIKNKLFLSLALANNAVITADSFDELADIVKLATERKCTPKLLIRLNGFAAGHTRIASKDSRFGISIQDAPQIFEFLSIHKNALRFLGFAFHLESNSDSERLVAVENVLQLSLEAINHGIHPRVVNIGGGFPVTLLEKLEEWEAYVTALKQGILGKHAPLVWNKGGLGFRNDNGTLAGSPQFREHVISPAGAAHLSRFLAQPLPSFDGRTVQSILSELMLELFIEPGKAVFDQAGVTLADVIAVKKSMHRENVIIADINKTNLNAAEIEHMVDPVVISDHAGKPGEGYIGGNLCSGSDMIYRHKTFFEQMPQKGDLLAFPNTASYLMDFNESNILQQPVAEKVAYWKDGANYRWARDSDYAL
jgi:diaminopimelate decarboxylase